MDNRILHDPHLEVMPDHAGPHYNLLRIALTQNGLTVEQAVQALNDSWTQNHDARALAWDQQVAPSQSWSCVNLHRKSKI